MHRRSLCYCRLNTDTKSSKHLQGRVTFFNITEDRNLLSLYFNLTFKHCYLAKKLILQIVFYIDTVILTLYTPNPGSTSVLLLDVGGWVSRTGLEDLKPFLVLLVELLVTLVAGLVSLMMLVVMLLPTSLSLLVLVSISAGGAGAGELWLSDRVSGGGAELQATPE